MWEIVTFLHNVYDSYVLTQSDHLLYSSDSLMYYSNIFSTKKTCTILILYRTYKHVLDRYDSKFHGN